VKFVIKWLLNGVIVSLMLVFFSSITFWSAIATATILMVIAYFVGDRWILRATNNTVAAVADGVLAVVFLWLAAYLMRWDLNFGEILITAAVLAVCEWALHRYVFHSQKYMAATGK